MKVSIVIPVYNEERGIGATLERTLAAREGMLALDGIEAVEVIVVNDGSTDATFTTISRFPEVIQVIHPTNRGYGAALLTGFQMACGDVLGFLDADGTYPPEAFLNLLKTLAATEADMVVGSRMANPSSRMPVLRVVGNRLYALLLSWLVRQSITDTSSGMRVFRRAILPTLLPLPAGLHFTPAMSTRAFHEGLKIVEVPIPYEDRVGRSKLHVVRDGLRFFLAILNIARLYDPLKFFGVIGGSILLIALLLSLAPLAHYWAVRRVEEDALYRLFTVMVLLVAGVNVISFGAFSNTVLSIISGKASTSRSFWERLLLRGAVIRHFDKIGASLILIAVLVNHRTIYQYLTMRKIYVHWSYILFGATTSLIGMQLMLCAFLIKALEELRKNLDRALPPEKLM